jgi:O-antigen/teichoic acid export membrane protein
MGPRRLRGGALAFALQGSGTVLSFVTQAALARILGPLAFGQYTYATNFAQLASVPADLGGSTSVSRLLPEHRVNRQLDLVRGVVRLSRLIALVVGLGIAGLALFGSRLLGSGPVSLSLLALASIGVPLFALTLVQMNLLRALGEIFWALGPYLTFQPVVLLALCLARRHDLTPVYVVAATVGSLVALAAVQAALIRRALARRGLRVERSRAYDLGRWRRITLPMLTINLIQLVFQKMDIIAVGLLLGARSAGIYALAYRIAGVTSLMANSYASAIAPQIAELHWSGRTEAAEALVLKTLRTTLIPAAAVFLAIAVVGGHVMAFFGHGYVSGQAALVAYAAGQLVSVSFGPVGFMAAMIGRERAMASRSAVAALLAIVGYACLIPTMGLLGAALANAIGTAYRNIAARRLVGASGYRISLRAALQRSGAS